MACHMRWQAGLPVTRISHLHMMALAKITTTYISTSTTTYTTTTTTYTTTTKPSTNTNVMPEEALPQTCVLFYVT